MKTLLVNLIPALWLLLAGSNSAAQGPPVIAVSPDSLSDSLLTDETSSHVLTISNSGGSDLVFAIWSVSEAWPPLSMTVDEALNSLIARSGIRNGPLHATAAADALSADGAEEVISRPEDVARVARSTSASAPGLDVALVAAASSAALTDVQSKLAATDRFGSVSIIDARFVTPTLSELGAFDAVMVFSDQFWGNTYYDRTTLGDTLAAYVDRGGGVVSALFEVAGDSDYRLGGRWESEPYYAITRGSVAWGYRRHLGVVAEPSHPIMAGVSSFNGGDVSLRPFTKSLTEGSTLIASWSDGLPLVVTKEVGAARRVDLGFFPPSGDLSASLWQVGTDGALLMANALKWVSESSWLTADPNAGTVPAGGSMDIAVIFDATDRNGGDYWADLLIESNDAVRPEVRVPAQLHVIGVPDIALSDTQLDYGVILIGAVAVDTLVISNLGSDVLMVTDMASDLVDFSVDVTTFSVSPDEQRTIPVYFTPSATGAINATLTILTNDPDEAAVQVPLLGEGIEPPVIGVSRDSVRDTLFTGERVSHTLTINNSGAGDLVFDISLHAGSATAAAPTVDEALASVITRSGIQNEEIQPDAAVQTAIREAGDVVPAGTGDVVSVLRAGSGSATGSDVVILATSDAPLVADVQNKLFATEKFSSVSSIDVRLVTPTLTELRAFDAVLIWSQSAYADRDALGDELAAYADEGGGVVCAIFEVAGTSDNRLGGRWESEQYYAIDRGDRLYGYNLALGDVADPLHPVMRGVSSFDGGQGSYRPNTTSLTEGSNLIASWSDGMPLVVTRDMGLGRRVDLGFFPPSSDVSFTYWQVGTDGDLLMANALDWVSDRWLAVEPRSGTVAAGGSLDVAVTLNAFRRLGGEHLADLVIASNDPISPELILPADLHVTAAPDIELSDVLFDFGPQLVGAVLPETLVIANEGALVLMVSDISSSHADFSVDVASFSVNPSEAQKVVVSFAPSTLGTMSGTLTITSDDPDEPTLTVSLGGSGLAPPVIAVSPDSLSDSLWTGESSTHTLTISNTGESELSFSASIAERSEPLARLKVDEAVASVIARSGVLEGSLRSGWTDTAELAERSREVPFKPQDVACVVRPPGGAGLGPDVAIVAAEHPPLVLDVQNKLLATGKFGSVSSINVGLVTPTLAEIRAFDAILVFSDQYLHFTYLDRTALGDTLAIYVDRGGGVVCAISEVAGESTYGLGGRWDTEQFYAIERGDRRYGTEATLGAVSDPSHPLMAGVTSFSGGPASHRPSSTSLTAGSNLIASWSDGMPLVVTREIGPARRVDLGLLPLSSDVTAIGWQAGTDGDLIMANALEWVARSWVSVQPNLGTVPGGASLDIDVTFDAYGRVGGDYLADLVIANNDPIRSEVLVPIFLHVTGAPAIALSDALLDYGTQFIGAVIPETLVISNDGTDVLTVSDISSDHEDFTVDVTSFSVNAYREQPVVVFFQPSSPAVIEGTLTIVSNDPVEPTLTVSLTGTGLEPPVISVSPDSLSDTLFMGATSTHGLTIANTGVSELVFDVSLADVASSSRKLSLEDATASAIEDLEVRAVSPPVQSTPGQDHVTVNTAERALESWIMAEPMSGSIPEAGSIEIAVSFDAAGLDGGDYLANLVITNNDPITPEVIVPTHLHVIRAPDIALSDTLFDYGTQFIGAVIAETLVVANVGNDVLTVSDISSDHADVSVDIASFSVNPYEAQEVVIFFAPSAPGAIDATLTITSNDPDEPAVTVSLAGSAVEPPVIAVSPDSFLDSLFTGETSAHTLTIANDGVSDLLFDIVVAPVAWPSAGLTVDEALASLVARSGTSQETPREGSTTETRSGGRSRETLTSAEDVACVLRSASGPMAGPEVAILAVAPADWVADVQSKLLSTGKFSSVSSIDVGLVTPTPAELKAFDAVLVWKYWGGWWYYYDYSDRIALGDALAAYVDGGGGVVTAIGEVAGATYAMLGGRWESEVYYAIARSGWACCAPATLGAVTHPAHPIMMGVSTFDGGEISLRPETTSLTDGSALVASWSDGMPLVVTKNIGPGRRVDLGFFPPSSDALSWGWLAATDGGILMANALEWAATSWIAVEPASDTVPAGSSVDVAVVLNATRKDGGDYLADLMIRSNDPIAQEVTVPTHLHVTAAPDIVLSDTLFDYGAQFIGAVIPETLAVANEGPDVLTVSDISSDHADFTVDVISFSLDPDGKQEVVVFFAPSSTGAISGTLTVTSDDPDEPVLAVPVQGIGVEPPVIAVSPDSLADSLLVGETSVQTLAIANTGVSDLEFNIRFGAKASPSATLAVDEALASLVARSRISQGVIREAATTQAQSGERRRKAPARPGEVASVVRPAAAPEAGLNVAILAAEEYDWVVDVQNKLLATGKFGSVSSIDARSVTPNLAELNAFDAVLVWSDWGYDNSTALGDTMAAFVDRGGGVVCAVFEVAGGSHLGGRWESEQYFAIARGWDRYGYYETLGALSDPSHPLLAGVSSFDGGYASFRPNTTSLTEGSTLIASWSDGAPLVVAKGIGFARRVDLGFFPPSSDVYWDSWQSETDGALLMANALEWVAKPEWLDLEPISGTVPAGGSMEIAVTFNAEDLYGGDYLVDLLIASNDPITPEMIVPSHLHVTGEPDIALSDTLIDYGLQFIGAVTPETLVVANVGTDVLTVSDISCEHEDFSLDVTSFSLSPEEEQMVIVSLAPSTTGAISTGLTITSNDPDEATIVVPLLSLCAEPPVIDVALDSLSDSLFRGETSTHTLTIANTGASDLVFEIASITSATSSRVPSIGDSPASLIGNSGLREGTLQVEAADGDFPPDITLEWSRVSWLTAEPDTGTVPAGGSMDIAITLSASGLGFGVHECFILISSNDPSTPDVAVTACLSVMEATLGDLNGDFTVNCSDVIYLVNYIFRAGPEPRGQSGTVDCDFSVTLQDVIVLTNFLFKGGTLGICP